MTNQIKKAIIPAAGMGTRFLPATKAVPKEMLPIINIPTIQYIVEEAVKSGIEEILIVVSSTKNAIIDHFDYIYELEKRLLEKNKIEEYNAIRKIANLAKIQFVRQKEPLGLGHAISCARSFANNQAFAVLLGDDVVVTDKDQKPSLKQCIDAYLQTKSSIVGVQKISKEDVSKYGIISPVDTNNLDHQKIIKLKDMVEKPSIELAPSQYAILGRYVLTPEIFDALDKVKKDKSGEIQLTDGIKELMKSQDVHACEFSGVRYDIGTKIGYIKATIDFALNDSSFNTEIKKYFLNRINK